jgi:uncharacterized protein (DUF39 family)
MVAGGMMTGKGTRSSHSSRAWGRGINNLQSLALDVQLQTMSVTWLKAISVGMWYFISTSG